MDIFKNEEEDHKIKMEALRKSIEATNREKRRILVDLIKKISELDRETQNEIFKAILLR